VGWPYPLVGMAVGPPLVGSDCMSASHQPLCWEDVSKIPTLARPSFFVLVRGAPPFTPFRVALNTRAKPPAPPFTHTLGYGWNEAVLTC
jgi:hypothetical protein